MDKVKLPKFHVQKVSGEKTVNEERGSLVVHRVKPLFGRLGQYQSVVIVQEMLTSHVTLSRLPTINIYLEMSL